jgi:hypothetical protein
MLIGNARFGCMKTRFWLCAISPLLAGQLTLVGFSLSQPAQAEDRTLDAEVTALRPLGQSGLQQFLERHAQELRPSALLPPKPLRDALDSLCQQRDCYASRLYWYTDLEQAKAAAKTSGKPILSLRLLGRLDQDLSCANSRFFRVALYPNAEVSKVLRDRFILHWQSVRPVPKVTIDFGDGRKLERTLTGNSIHYILDASGRPIEAIPGLYGPQAFLRQLQQGEVAAKVSATKTGFNRDTYLRQYYGDRLNTTQAQWSADLANVGLKMPSQLANLSRNVGTMPRADVAGTLAVSKMTIENPIVSATLNQNTLAQLTDQDTWAKLAQRHTQDAKLDAHSIHLIQAKQAAGVTAQPRSISSMVQSFESTMALDTVRNEYLLHSQLHQWLMQGKDTLNVDALNDKVYAELFLTPKTDPWLGLLPSNSYSAIDNDGILKSN